MIQKILHSTLVRTFAVLLAVDAALFTGVNPQTAPSLILMVGFVLLVTTLYVGLLLALRWFGAYVPAVQQRARRLSLLFSLLFGLLLGLQSIGQLSIRDLFAVVPLLAVAYFYISYYRSNP